ncbi:hypothetical protein ACFZBU_25535 [Embleya sp. NPDC008237]|uniref:hypothetical protein n=1 Tax=Embleya sp. NPDC008237 TaxID=3363978 RepID=UPI0036E84802
MANGSGEVTEEQVREKAARFRAALEGRRIEGFDAAAALDVEAAARRALEARARPRVAARDVLGVIRPAWEEEAAKQGLTGEALRAFALQILADDGPMAACEMDGLWYSIHLNKAAVELIENSSELFNNVLEMATEIFEDLELILIPLEAFVDAESNAIKAVADQSNGQVQLEGYWPSPFAIPIPDPDFVWGIGNITDHWKRDLGE